jgi:tyrosyl-tRNA synthetase
MQGYDSVAVKADVELGGTDQKFNIAVGRDLQRHFGLAPQFGLLLPLLAGHRWGCRKMSKSLGNYVGLQEDPLTMYSKLEKVPDAMVPQYFELLTRLPLDTLPENPRDRQKALALEITRQFHGETLQPVRPNRTPSAWCKQAGKRSQCLSFPWQRSTFRPRPSTCSVAPPFAPAAAMPAAKSRGAQ